MAMQIMAASVSPPRHEAQFGAGAGSGGPCRMTARPSGRDGRRACSTDESIPPSEERAINGDLIDHDDVDILHALVRQRGLFVALVALNRVLLRRPAFASSRWQRKSEDWQAIAGLATTAALHRWAIHTAASASDRVST
jgi:hypothetical protein